MEPQSYTVDGFEREILRTEPVPQAYLIFVGCYVAFCLLAIVPMIVIWNRRMQRRRQKQHQQQEREQRQLYSRDEELDEEGGEQSGVRVKRSDETSLPGDVEHAKGQATAFSQSSGLGVRLGGDQEMINLGPSVTAFNARSDEQEGQYPSQQPPVVQPPQHRVEISVGSVPMPTKPDASAEVFVGGQATTATVDVSPVFQPPPDLVQLPSPTNAFFANPSASPAAVAAAAQDDMEVPTGPTPMQSDRQSNVPSVATTSRIHQLKRKSKGVIFRPLMGWSDPSPQPALLEAEKPPSNTETATTNAITTTTFYYPIRAWDLVGSRIRCFQLDQPLTPSQSMRRSLVAERMSQLAASEEAGSSTSRGGGGGGGPLAMGMGNASGAPVGGPASRMGGAGGATYRSGHSNQQPLSSLNSGSRSGSASLAANETLAMGWMEGEAEFYRQRYLERTVMGSASVGRRFMGPTASAMSMQSARRYQQRSQRGRRHGTARRRQLSSTMSCSSGNRSLMPPLPQDALTPEDAADAHDPGIAPAAAFEEPQQENKPCCRWHGPFVGFLAWALGGILDLAEPDFETKRILTLSIPSTIAAMSDPLFRLVLVAILSHYVDTDSMVAYVLVILFVRITTVEISGAIADTESNLIQDALAQGGDHGFYMAGQYVQQAMVMQLVIGILVMIMWVFIMEDVVLWLVASPHIAQLAATYTRIIVIEYLLRGVTRTFMLPFHLNGQGQFESNVDLMSTLFAVIGIFIVACVTHDPAGMSLQTIGRIQVLLGLMKTIIKILYVALKGWLQPYRVGLLQTATLWHTRALWRFFLQSLPLFIGSIIELGEWELLILIVRHLGDAEVAAWAIMGIIWEVFSASTEGLGEASAVRVSFYLSEGFAAPAKKLSYKVIFLVSIEAWALTSVFYVIGPNIAIALTRDSTLQFLINQLVGLTGLANIAMTYTQSYWSLAGAQNRFSMASATILACRWFVIAPIAVTCVFGYRYDVTALAGAVAVGYATAAILLGKFVFQCDWYEISHIVQEQHLLLDDDESSEDDDDEDDDEDDDDDSDDSSDHF